MKNLRAQMPIKRQIFYLVLLGFLPMLFLLFDYSSNRNALTLLEKRVETARLTAAMKEEKQAFNTAVREKFGEADQLFIDKELEKHSLLNKERVALEKLLTSKAFTGNEAAEKRYAFLAGPSNRLLFNEGSVQTGEGFQETTESLAHSIEIDAADLKELLRRMEKSHPGQPQLIITEFKLDKKQTSLDNEVFDLNLKLLKREFLESCSQKK